MRRLLLVREAANETETYEGKSGKRVDIRTRKGYYYLGRLQKGEGVLDQVYEQ